MTNFISDEQWAQYERDGYLRLGKILSDTDLKALQDRIDDIMLGKASIDYNKLLMQLDSSDGNYQNVGVQSRGFKEATLDYRKIQELENDPLFLEYMQRPLFREICAHVYGEDTPISLFRAMFMNKPANRGTFLPWHQDRWNNLNIDPLITVWTALDPATVENGCVQIIEGSHKFGLINPDHSSGFVTPEQAEKLKAENPIVFVELEPGEVVLLHNWLLHSSDRNNSSVSRRAFSVCYMDAATRTTNGDAYPVVFGPGALELAAA